MFLRRLKDVTRKTYFLRCFWDVLKTSQKIHLFEMFLRGLWDISLHGDLFENSQRHLMPAGQLLYSSYFETQSVELIQNRHCRTCEAIKVSIKIYTHIFKWIIVYTLFILSFINRLHLKIIFTLKNSSSFANLLMEKPGNWFAIAKV